MRSRDRDVGELLRSRGLRPTRARRLIMARLLEDNDHMNAEGIRLALRRGGHDVSVATLYQNLNRLAEAGLLARFADRDGLVRFDANTEAHAHLVCTRCGRIADIDPEEPVLRDAASRVPVPARSFHGWSLARARLELHGLCPRCRRLGRTGA